MACVAGDGLAGLLGEGACAVGVFTALGDAAGPDIAEGCFAGACVEVTVVDLLIGPDLPAATSPDSEVVVFAASPSKKARNLALADSEDPLDCAAVLLLEDLLDSLLLDLRVCPSVSNI